MVKDRKAMRRRAPVMLGMVMALFLSIGVLGTRAADAGGNVVPPQAHPHGQSYSEWAADWWQWALEEPTPTNPLIDQTGAQCASGQTGNVWFLAGELGSGTTTRTCSISTGTALFFPMFNGFSCAFLNDPPEFRTEEFLRSVLSGIPNATVSASIDGTPVANPQTFFEESPVFEIQLPADNIFGLTPDVAPELLLSPCVDAGFYLFVNPLNPGAHTIHFTGSLNGTEVDVTYNLTVTPGHP